MYNIKEALKSSRRRETLNRSWSHDAILYRSLSGHVTLLQCLVMKKMARAGFGDADEIGVK